MTQITRGRNDLDLRVVTTPNGLRTTVDAISELLWLHWRDSDDGEDREREYLVRIRIARSGPLDIRCVVWASKIEDDAGEEGAPKRAPKRKVESQ